MVLCLLLLRLGLGWIRVVGSSQNPENREYGEMGRSGRYRAARMHAPVMKRFLPRSVALW